jgi:hypothetical protein
MVKDRASQEPFVAGGVSASMFNPFAPPRGDIRRRVERRISLHARRR